MRKLGRVVSSNEITYQQRNLITLMSKFTLLVSISMMATLVTIIILFIALISFGDNSFDSYHDDDFDNNNNSGRDNVMILFYIQTNWMTIDIMLNTPFINHPL